MHVSVWLICLICFSAFSHFCSSSTACLTRWMENEPISFSFKSDLSQSVSQPKSYMMVLWPHSHYLLFYPSYPNKSFSFSPIIQLIATLASFSNTGSVDISTTIEIRPTQQLEQPWKGSSRSVFIVYSVIMSQRAGWRDTNQNDKSWLSEWSKSYQIG